MGIIVENPGILTTVQDAGRFGYQQFGVSPAGPMDVRSFHLANILVGNNRGEGVLEMTFSGASITFDQDNIIAVTGAAMSPSINGNNYDGSGEDPGINLGTAYIDFTYGDGVIFYS